LKKYITFDSKKLKLDSIYPLGEAVASPMFFYTLLISPLFILFPTFCFAQIDLTASTINSNSTSYTKKNVPEVGLHMGSFFISGDISPRYTKSYGGGVHYRSALNHVVSIRYDFLIANSTGLGANAYGSALVQDENIFNGYSDDNPYFFSYQSTVLAFGADLLFELTNLAPQIKFKSWNVHAGFGLGFYNSNTRLNLKNDQNQPYSDLINKTSFNIDNDFNTNDGRKEIKAKLQEIYDDSYETSGPKKAGVFRLGNETNVSLYAKATFGVVRKINKRLSIGIEYSSMFSDNDLLDGSRWRTDSDLSNHNDVMHYFNIRLGYNLYKSSNSSEPLFWINPWQEMEDKLELEQEILDSLAFDTDLDGVPDLTDLEKNSLANCPVDRDGVVLDSDGDGKPDCLDSDPYLNDKLLEEKVKQLFNQFEKEDKSSKKNNDLVNLSLEEYSKMLDSLLNVSSFNSLVKNLNNSLPEIYFNKNQDLIDVQGYRQIMTVVKTLDKYPTLNVRVSGYSSDEGSNEYNINLSLQRASSVQHFLIDASNIEPNRIQINGLGSSKARFISDEKFKFLDRKVSFKFY